MAGAFLNDSMPTTSAFVTTSDMPHCARNFDHEPTSAVAVIEGLTMTIIFLASLLANLTALVAILGHKSLRSNRHNWLIINLIVNDLGITISSMPFSIVSVFDEGCFLMQNTTLCAIHGALANAFSFGNFSTIAAISLDRYLAVVWPSRFPPTKTRLAIFLVVCWIVPIANAIPPFLKVLSDFRYHPLTHHCTPVWEVCIYYIISVTILFGVMVPVMGALYAAVVWTLWRKERQLRSYSNTPSNKDAAPSNKANQVTTRGEASYTTSDGGINLSLNSISTALQESSGIEAASNLKETAASDEVGVESGLPVAHFGDDKAEEKPGIDGADGDNGEDQSHKTGERMKQKKLSKKDKLSAEKTVALTAFLLVMTTVICWAPYCIVHSCFIRIPRAHRTHALGVFTMWLAYTNSLLDPLIYSLLNRKVRARYVTMFRCVRDADLRETGRRMSRAIRQRMP